MRGSLQDQLLQSGIATEDQLKKSKPKSKPGSKSGSKRKPSSKPVSKPKPEHQANTQDKSQRPSQQKQKTQYSSKAGSYKKTTTNKAAQARPAGDASALGKALRAEIKQLLKTNKLNNKEGEIAYNYVIAGQVKRFFITEKQQIDLKAGNLVIVNWNAISYLISTEAKQALRKLHPTIEVASVDMPSSADKTEKKKDDNDPYADYAIPDDISW